MVPRIYFRFILILPLSFNLVDTLDKSGCENKNDYTSLCIQLDDDVCKANDHKLSTTLLNWDFNQQHVLRDTFPLDPIQDNYVREVKNVIFSVTYPVPLRTAPVLAAISDDVLVNILDLDPAVSHSSKFIDFVSGNKILKGAVPLTHRYGGHQFGFWSGQLGDGRAVMLGEYINKKGERWELQLKGSGLTPYSRRGDGRAVIRSSVREFLCSEALHYLGIPTSRAASLVVSDDPVVRDQFYNGHPRTERAAVVLRLAESWFRFGSLEILSKTGEIALLKNLTDFIISKYFADIGSFWKDRYLELYSRVVEQTADMIVKWQSVGFTHGVCNTDNFSILSITIDFGPFGFLDEYNPQFIPNTSDDEGRYSYEKQPDVGYYNLDKLRQALLPLLTSDQASQMNTILQGYVSLYKLKFMDRFKRKIGLLTYHEDDEQIIAILLKMMEDTRADFTMTFRQLSEINIFDFNEAMASPGNQFWALKVLAQHRWFDAWIRLYTERLNAEGRTETKRQSIMKSVNPRYVLRNWIAQIAIEKAEENDFSRIIQLLRILERPFLSQDEADKEGFASPPPQWAKSLKVSCSS